jgi:hypothetical protein
LNRRVIVSVDKEDTVPEMQWTLRLMVGDHRRVDDEQRHVRVQATPIRHVLSDADGVFGGSAT